MSAREIVIFQSTKMFAALMRGCWEMYPRSYALTNIYGTQYSMVGEERTRLICQHLAMSGYRYWRKKLIESWSRD